jgi:sugar/nucleoside kinase (ribokinase family)
MYSKAHILLCAFVLVLIHMITTGKQQTLQSILKAVAFASAVGASVVQVHSTG